LNQTRAAEILGIDRVTLHHKLKRYGWSKPTLESDEAAVFAADRDLDGGLLRNSRRRWRRFSHSLRTGAHASKP
jgi:hypothetical protein